jgi:hypothetical protein
MAAGVALVMAVLPVSLPPLAVLVLTVPLGIGLYLGLLHLMAPGRLAEALRFARNPGEAEPLTKAPD